jgi:type I restriction enzyme, S subunit
MKFVPISSAAKINPRLPREFSVDRSRKVSFLPMSGITEEGQLTGVEERSLEEVVNGYTYFQRGDVVIAKITPCMENGKAGLLDSLPHDIGFGSTEFHVLRPGSDIDARYLFYMVWNPSFRRLAEQSMTGSAGQKRVPSDFFTRYKIPLPPLPDQRRIAAILHMADAIRRKQQRVMERMEDFPRSVFFDMFGDPVTNPKGWQVAGLGTVAMRFSDGPFGSNLKTSHYVDAGVRVVRLQNIGVGKFLDEAIPSPKMEMRQGG